MHMAHPVGRVMWHWCQGEQDWWRESMMKVRACHLCGSRNFSPHWCTTHFHNSFSLLLPTFSRSSLKLATIHLHLLHTLFCCSANVISCPYFHLLSTANNWKNNSTCNGAKLIGGSLASKVRMKKSLFTLLCMERKWMEGKWVESDFKSVPHNHWYTSRMAKKRSASRDGHRFDLKSCLGKKWQFPEHKPLYQKQCNRGTMWKWAQRDWMRVLEWKEDNERKKI